MANFNFARNCEPTFPTIASDSVCGCAETAEDCECDCGCERNCSCGCAAAVSAAALSITDSDTCTCCKRSMREALKLLCCNAISDFVDFNAFAFISDINYVGTTPVDIGEGTADNLGGFEGVFRRFSPSTCDLIDIGGTVFTPSGLTVAVDQANLCTLTAIAFELLPVTEEPANDGCCEDTDLRRFRRVRRLLQQQLQPMNLPCGECMIHCDCSNDCCCTGGILTALSSASLNRRTTLSAGLLSVRDVTALGTIGNVLVLANEEQGRFYFVCANKVDFLV